MEIRAHVSLIGQDIEDGETRRGECPACGRHDTFTVTRKDGGLVYNCYAASCDLDGGVVGASNRPSIAMPSTARVRKEPEPFAEPLVKLVTSQEEELNERFNLRGSALRDIRWCPSWERYAFRILGPIGERRGWVLRSLVAGVNPKALTYLERDASALSWVRSDGATTVVAVEDIPSALRLYERGVSAAALLGTSCGEDKAAELSKYAKRIIWALDADATATAARLHRRHRFLFAGSSVAVMKRDIKDMTEDEFDEFCSLYV